MWHLITAAVELGTIWDPLGAGWRQFCPSVSTTGEPPLTGEANNRDMTLMVAMIIMNPSDEHTHTMGKAVIW